jgi:hypothetical protein
MKEAAAWVREKASRTKLGGLQTSSSPTGQTFESETAFRDLGMGMRFESARHKILGWGIRCYTKRSMLN